MRRFKASRAQFIAIETLNHQTERHERADTLVGRAECEREGKADSSFDFPSVSSVSSVIPAAAAVILITTVPIPSPAVAAAAAA